MSKVIRIGSVSIPLDSYVVGGTAILGIRESGKSYLAKGIAEQLLEHGVPIVVFDAIGVWRYLKVAGVGSKPKGFKVVVAGGKEPDLPLTPESAPEIVRAAIRENIPLIIDLYSKKLSKADWRKIVQNCFRTLLYENEGLRHIFLEETAEYAPQKVIDGQTYAEVEKLVRMGGNASLGITLINQRAQEVNKALLDLCENMVLMRQRGSHAIDSLEKWMDRLSPDSAREVSRSMPHMGQGDAWVFTAAAEAPTRTRSDLIRSFHPDRRKPQLSQSTAVAADTSDFVHRLSKELTTVVAEAEANDPKMLRKCIADLEQQLRSGRGPSPEDLAAAEEKGFQRGVALGREAQCALLATLQLKLESAVDSIIDAAKPDVGPLVRVVTHPSPTKLSPATRHALVSAATVASTTLSNGHALSAQPRSDDPPSVRKILDVIHRAYPVSLSFDAAARRATISSTSSAYRKYRVLVHGSAEIEHVDGKYRSRPEFAGGAPMDSETSIAQWVEKLPPSYGKMLQAIHDQGPADKDRIAELAGVSPTSSGLGSGLRELQRLQLIAERDGRWDVEDGLR